MPRHFVVPLPGDRRLQLGARTLVMGIINVTPDSFSDGGALLDPARAIEAGVRLAAEGADLLDIGGESTRPGALPLSAAEEMRRVLPVVQGIASRVSIPLSIDTYKATVADAALSSGAAMVNDISGLRYDPALAEVVARRGAALILMHTRGRSRDMYEQATYHDVVDEVLDELRESIGFAQTAGINSNALLVDPGFGFGKTPEQNLTLLRELGALRVLGRPILLGTSRKSTLGLVLDLPVEERLEATLATTALGIANGADVVRVHDVHANVRAARMTDAVVRGWRPASPLERAQ